MKYKKFIQAYNVLQKLSNMDFNVKDAFSIYNLQKSLEPVTKFGAERDRALIEKYKGVVGQDVSIKFWESDEDEEEKRIGTENMTAFIEEICELNDMEMDQEITPITLSYDSLGDQKISPNDIMCLDGFVHFE